MRLDVLAKRARFVTRGRIARHEHLYFPLVGLKPRHEEGPRPVTRDVDIVVEGYPRSGNSFAYYALQIAHESRGGLRIAHHLHAPAQLSRAARLGIPAVLLLRSPLDAAASFAQREPAIGGALALAYWVRFHEDVLPYADSYVIAPFPDVTSDFGKVIARVNARFATDFLPFDHTEANVAACFRRVETRNAELLGRSEPAEHMVSRPSAERRQMRSETYREFEHPRLRQLRRRADEVFAELSRLAGESGLSRGAS